MRGMGTLINVALIILGGILGLLFGKRIGGRMRETLMTATGVAVMFLGIGGAMEKMLTASASGQLASGGAVMMIVSLAAGAVLGELINIQGGVERFGRWLRDRTGSGSDGSFVGAFVSASCTVCIGAMAVVGAIDDGIAGDYSVLLAKGLLDAVIICIMTASHGKGCVFSTIPVAVFQGLITLAAALAGPFMTAPALANLSYVGSVLIFCVGLNIVREKQIRVANLLPSIFIAAAWGFFAP